MGSWMTSTVSKTPVALASSATFSALVRTLSGSNPSQDTEGMRTSVDNSAIACGSPACTASRSSAENGVTDSGAVCEAMRVI